MIKHVVFMKFKSGVTEEQVAELQRMLGALPGKIPDIREYSFGKDVVRSERSVDFALVSAFDDLDALKRYSGHPEHLPVLSLARNLSEMIFAADYVFSV